MDSVQITLACGNTVVIDADCVEILKKHRFRLVPTGVNGRPYVVRHTCDPQGKSVAVYLHRAITGAQEGQVVDHINNDPLDNRRANLRICTRTENMRNRKKHADGKTSVFKGVSRSKYGRYMAHIRDGKNQIYLGTFKREEEAAFSYDCASLEIHKEFGKRNFLPLVV